MSLDQTDGIRGEQLSATFSKVKTISLVDRNCAVIVVKIVNFIQALGTYFVQTVTLITAPTLHRYEYISNPNIMSILSIIFELTSIEN